MCLTGTNCFARTCQKENSLLPWTESGKFLHGLSRYCSNNSRLQRRSVPRWVPWFVTGFHVRRFGSGCTRGRLFHRQVVKPFCQQTPFWRTYEIAQTWKTELTKKANFSMIIFKNDGSQGKQRKIYFIFQGEELATQEIKLWKYLAVIFCAFWTQTMWSIRRD